MQKAAGQIAVPSLIISVARKTCWQSAALMWMIFTSHSIPAEVRNTAKTACKRCSVWHCGAGNSKLTFHFYLPLITLMVLAFLRERYCAKITSYGWLWIFFAVFLYFLRVFLLLLKISVPFLSRGSSPCTVIGFPVPIVTQIEGDGQRIPKLRFLA